MLGGLVFSLNGRATRSPPESNPGRAERDCLRPQRGAAPRRATTCRSERAPHRDHQAPLRPLNRGAKKARPAPA
eukprot:8090061-Lingulodinium_polyedra.AAC.1